MRTRANILAFAGVLALTNGCGDDKPSNAQGNGAGKDAGAARSEAGGEQSCTGGVGTETLKPSSPDDGCVTLEKTPVVEKNGITLPDSLCGDEKCQVGGCDPTGATEPACNAWLMEGTVSFQAVRVGEMKSLGLPPPPDKADGDECPGVMSTPQCGSVNCCQRVTEQGETPALKLTGLLLTRPKAFATAAVTQANKGGLEGDLYNWVVTLDRGTDGDVLLTTGNALPNTDGSFTPLRGAFESQGIKWNEDGAWDVHTNIPGKLATKPDGTRVACLGPTESNRDVVMARWYDERFDFPQLQLHMAGIQWEVPFNADLTCGGQHNEKGFDTVGELHGFLPLAGAKMTGLYLGKGGSALNLCSFISGAQSCDGKPGDWK